MKNITLNLGGLIGALVCGGLAAAIIIPNVNPDSGRAPYKLIIFALIGGAFGGNFLWGRAFNKAD